MRKEVFNKPLQAFLLSAITIGIVTFSVTFHFGVAGVVQYHQMLTIWVICSIVLFVSWTQNRSILSVWSTIALLSPTLWLVVRFIDNLPGEYYDVSDVVIRYVSIIIMTLSVPYVVYIITLIMQRDVHTLDKKQKKILSSLVVFLAVAGLLMGCNHQLFFSCTDFNLSGDYVPNDCVKIDESL